MEIHEENEERGGHHWHSMAPLPSTVTPKIRLNKKYLEKTMRISTYIFLVKLDLRPLATAVGAGVGGMREGGGGDTRAQYLPVLVGRSRLC